MDKKDKIKNGTKKLFLLLCITISLVFISGCVDFLHYIGEENNNILIDVRFTLQKLIFIAFAEMSGETVTDEYFEKEFGLSEEEFKEELSLEFPPFIKTQYEKINTQLEFGYDVQLKINKKVFNQLLEEDPNIPFVPIKSEKGIRIVLPTAMESEPDSDDEEMTAVFLASAKYKLIISKKIISQIENVFIKVDNEVFIPGIKELPEVYLIEFPLATWVLMKKNFEINVY